MGLIRQKVVVIVVAVVCCSQAGLAAGSFASVSASGSVEVESGFVDVTVNTLPGNGTQDDPYVLTNASELQAMEDAPGAHYALGSDINASGTAQWNGGSGFDPIRRFSGSLDGNGHVIDGLYIRTTGEENTGLFAQIRNDGSVTGVGLTNVDVTGGKNYLGGSNVGALAGSNDGTVARCFSTGSVSNAGGGVTNAGGLVGNNYGTISASFSMADVSGNNQVGGLVGRMSGGSVSQSFATGSSSATFETGGLIGERKGGTVTDSYWDITASGESSSDGGTGLPTANMTGQAASENMTGFDFTNTWRTTEGYPDLRVFNPVESTPDPPAAVTFSDRTVSNGTADLTVDAAQYGNTSVPGGEFVVVVHAVKRTATGTEIGAKIGSSNVLGSGEHRNVSIDLSKTVGSNDSVDQLTAARTLVAMLHVANTSDGTAVSHGTPVTRNGVPVSARARVSIADSDGSASAPRLAVESATIGPNATATVELSLNTAPRGVAGYNVSVELEPKGSAEIVEATGPAAFNLTEAIVGPANQSAELRGSDAPDRIRAGATDIPLGSITVAGTGGTSVHVTVHVAELDDDNGTAITVTTHNGTVTITPQKPLVDGLQPPTDPDDDGMYEDLNGNGAIDFDDVVTLFTYLQQADAQYQDFNDNGRIDFDDIAELFAEI